MHKGPKSLQKPQPHYILRTNKRVIYSLKASACHVVKLLNVPLRLVYLLLYSEFIYNNHEYYYIHNKHPVCLWYDAGYCINTANVTNIIEKLEKKGQKWLTLIQNNSNIFNIFSVNRTDENSIQYAHISLLTIGISVIKRDRKQVKLAKFCRILR